MTVKIEDLLDQETRERPELRLETVQKLMRSFYERQYELVTQAYADYIEILHAHQERTNTCGPHCDSFVLHAPGVCTVCDEHAHDLQLARQLLAICFTGHDPVRKRQRPCPATLLREYEDINHWPGNLPYREES